MNNYYFTFWIARHSKENFKALSSKVCHNASIPQEIQENINTDEYLFHYFFIVYCSVALKFFGLNIEQISFTLDLLITPGTSKIFPPEKTFEIHKDVITEIEKYVLQDLETYKANK